MANRRMIAKSISVSDETNAVSDFAVILFTWMIPHVDDYGVIPGTPGRIKALVVPRRRQTEKDVEHALCELHAVGLIHRYVNNGQHYVQLVSFEQHQEGLHKRTVSKHPTYDAEGSETLSRNFREVPGNSPLTEPNLTEPNLNEGNRTTTEPNHPEGGVDYAVVVVKRQLKDNVCLVSNQAETDLIRTWLATYPRDWIDHAISEAALNKAKTIKYVDAVLVAWRQKYQFGDQPWVLDRNRKGRDRPKQKSFAMAKLEQMARDALAEEQGAQPDAARGQLS